MQKKRVTLAFHLQYKKETKSSLNIITGFAELSNVNVLSGSRGELTIGGKGRQKLVKREDFV